MLRIRDVYPGSRILIFSFYQSRISDPGSRIPDPKTGTKERDKKNLLSYLFFTKLKIILFWNAEEKNLCQFSKNYRTFYPKNFPYDKLSKIWVWDPGSRGQRGTGSKIRNTVIEEARCFHKRMCSWELFKLTFYMIQFRKQHGRCKLIDWLS